MAKLSKEEIEREAIEIVRQEVSVYEDGEVFITERVAFAMRDLIRVCRKNYWGVFDSPKDPITGRKKIWIPLTRNIVDAIRRNVDIDLKDMNVRSLTKKGLRWVNLIRGAVRMFLERMFFGDILDQSITPFCIDGTLVWKTVENKKGEMIRTNVDLLNIYIDPTADSIQDAYRFTERAVMSQSEVKGMTGWMNTDVEPITGIHPNDPNLDLAHGTISTKAVEVFEMWGKIPEKLITGNPKDTDEIEGRIVVSGIRRGNPTVHLVEKNTNTDFTGKPIKPYEEAWYTKVPGRWYGIGPAETLIQLQLLTNVVVNLRLNRNYIAQLGLFKVRAGSGITPQMMSRLASNGAIKVNSMDDIEQLIIQEAGVTSYKDEENAVDWAQRVTSAVDVVTGAPLPSSATATSSVIQDRNAKSAFVLIVESLDLFLQRWMRRHALKIIGHSYKKGDMVKFFGDIDDVKKIRESIIATIADKELERLWQRGIVPSEEEVSNAMFSARQKLENEADIFTTLTEDLMVKDSDIKFFVSNEGLDVGVTVSNLINTMQIAPEIRSVLVPKILDLLGVEASIDTSGLNGNPEQQATSDSPLQTTDLTQQASQANSLPGNFAPTA